MSSTCIGLWIGYLALFIMLIIMTKLYTREWELRQKAELKNIELVYFKEIESLKKFAKVGINLKNNEEKIDGN